MRAELSFSRIQRTGINMEKEVGEFESLEMITGMDIDTLWDNWNTVSPKSGEWIRFGGAQCFCATWAIPEQWEVHRHGRHIGFVHLRHGHLTAYGANAKNGKMKAGEDEIIFDAQLGGNIGRFRSENERERFMTEIGKTLVARDKKIQKKRGVRA